MTRFLGMYVGMIIMMMTIMMMMMMMMMITVIINDRDSNTDNNHYEERKNDVDNNKVATKIQTPHLVHLEIPANRLGRKVFDLLAKHWVECVRLEVILLVIFLFSKRHDQVWISLE